MTTANKSKGMCIATRCSSVDQFVQMFARFVDEDSFFVATHNTRPAGLETSFSVQLANGTPVLRGLCVVLHSWADANNVFRTPGVRLGIKRLTASSMHTFERLLITRSSTQPPPLPASAKSQDKTAELKPEREMDTAPTKVVPKPDLKPESTAAANRDDTEADAPGSETRTPGSDLVLPANPLMNLTDASLDGFVDCTLYEETGNFFPAEEEDGLLLTDDVVPPPVLAARRSAPVITLPPPIIPALPDVPNATEVSTLMRLSASLHAAPPPEVPAPSMLTPVPGALVAPTVTGHSFAGPLPVDYGAVPSLPNVRETPIPAGERLDLEPRARRKRPPIWLAAGGFGLVAAAACVIAIGIKSNDSSAQPPSIDPKPEVVAQAAAPKLEQPVVEDPTATDDGSDKTPNKPTGVVEDPDGPPMIGDGPCKLTVASTPAGSMVSVDGKILAPSPLTIATSCDKHRIDLAHARYQTATKMITLEEGKPGSVEVSLDRPTHSVSVTSMPSGATIFIDGRRAGTTPTVVNVVGFQRLKLEIKKTGFLSQNVSLYSKVAQDKVSVKLAKW